MAKKAKPIKAEAKRRADGTFGAGNLANPLGRPKGKTIKERVREYLEAHPDKMNEFVEHFINENRELAWQMLEGRPAQDMTSGGEKLPVIPIYGGQSIQGHLGNEKGIQPEEKD
jgi:hypothetical protein